MKNRGLLLLIICLAVSSCNMDCVEPGLQNRNVSININVPVRKVDKGVKINWVDSGQVISKDEKIKFNVNGSINFCPYKKDKNPRKVLVPAVFCNDGSIPNYSKAANINDVPNNYGVDEIGVSENELCSGRGFFGSDIRYVDAGIKVNPGDKLIFGLVPREVIIDYENPGKKVSFDDNCYRTKTGDEKVSAREILGISQEQGSEFFCEVKDGKRNKVKLLPLDKTKVKKRKVLVGNGYTPYDNKVHFNKDFITDDKPWINGALLDLRRAKVGLNELCKDKNCDLNEIKKYGSYELNCYYQNICYTKKGVWNNSIGEEWSRNCVSSVRYEKYDKKNKENKKEYKCDIYSHVRDVENKFNKIKGGEGSAGFISTNEEEDIQNILWAEALVVKIGDFSLTNNLGFNGKNVNTSGITQCLTKEKVEIKNDNQKMHDYMFRCFNTTDDFKDFSLMLNHTYEVNKNIKPGSDVMLAIAKDGFYKDNGSRGGYHVEVARSCEYINGQKLYMYLGNDPPKDFNGVGSNDFKVVGICEVVAGENKCNQLDVISGEHFQDTELKKIYFGIDVSNIEIEDITDEKGKFYENNHYNITIFVKRKINDLISSNVNKVFEFIKREVIGDRIEHLYKGYATGLLQSVRAILTLYTIFSVIGCIIGTIQISRFELIVRIIKIGFIAFAFSDKSWEMFGTSLSKIFIDSSAYLIDSFSGYIGDGGKRFAFLDLTAGVLFTGETWMKFISLMLAGPFGFMAFLVILYASFMFLKCIISATFRYVISTILVAFLLSLTPLFTVSILFQKTKFLFDSWIRTLAHIAVQPIILLSSLSILNQLMYSVLYNLTNFSACYQCLISINFMSHHLCLVKSILPLGYSSTTTVDIVLNDGMRTAGGHFAALPIDIIQTIIYFVIAKSMEVFVSASETVAQTIFGASYGVAGSVSEIVSSASQAIMSTVGLDNKTQSMIYEIKQKMSKDRRTFIEYNIPEKEYGTSDFISGKYSDNCDFKEEKK